MYPHLKGDDRNSALRVTLVSLFLFIDLCSAHCELFFNIDFFLLLEQQLISSLHDICQYLCAHARLGSSHARLGSQKLEFSGVTADWGGTEGIGKLTTAEVTIAWANGASYINENLC